MKLSSIYLTALTAIVALQISIMYKIDNTTFEPVLIDTCPAVSESMVGNSIKYYIDLPEEISQTEIGDRLQVLNIKGDTISLGFYPTHICFDSTHAKCDGECECDGMECSTMIKGE